ncbi:MAG: PilZ domain-containing protein [Candidatus Omnitrophica bacterium]|nr:PilZ domain-containing protein [Candidatus Omnitrophota bacterium]
MSEERREYIRKSGSLEVSYQLERTFIKSDAHSVNVSGAGIRLTTNQRLEPDTLIKLEICSKEINQCIKATGKVVWIEETQGKEYPYEMGVEFVNISRGTLETLKDIMSRLGKEDSDHIRWF